MRMTKSNKLGSTPLKQAPDMIKELNKTGGRYTPVWVEAPPALAVTDKQLKREITKPRKTRKRRTNNG